MSAILCVCDDAALNLSRAAVLRATGHHVVETAASSAVSLLDRHGFDLVLLCHAIAANAAATIMARAALLSNPPKLVAIDSPFGRSAPAMEGVLRIDPFEGPELLVEHVARALRLSSQPRQTSGFKLPAAFASPAPLPGQSEPAIPMAPLLRH